MWRHCMPPGWPHHQGVALSWGRIFLPLLLLLLPLTGPSRGGSRGDPGPSRGDGEEATPILLSRATTLLKVRDAIMIYMTYMILWTITTDIILKYPLSNRAENTFIHRKYCCWCFRWILIHWIVLALMVILRRIWPLWDFSLKHRHRQKCHKISLLSVF